MSDGWRDEPEASKADIAASDACTKSGAFALALSVVLALLAVAWSQRSVDDAVGEYLVDRYTLSSAVERLNDDPFWKRWQAEHGIKSTIPFTKLIGPVEDFYAPLDKPVTSPPDQTVPIHTSHSKVKNQGPQSKQSQRAFVPAAPIGLAGHVVTDISDVPQIANALIGLNKPDLLVRAAKYSNYFAFTIQFWNDRRYEFVGTSLQNGNCRIQPQQIHSIAQEGKPPAQLLDNDVFLNCLTLADVNTLASLDLPPINNPDQIGGHIGRDFDLSPGSLPRDPYKATLAAEAILLVVLLYFWAHANEALSSPRSPVPGTLFGAFAKSQLTAFAILLILWVPAFSSIAVAVQSRRQPIAVCSLMIVFTVLGISLTIAKKLI
jgi:hypothetical protein